MQVIPTLELSTYTGRLKSLLFEDARQATPPSAVAAIADDEAETLYRRVMERRTEYAEFSAVWQALAEPVPETQARLRAALAILAARGISAESLLRALQVHQGDLEGERLREQERVRAEQQTRVDLPRDKIQALDHDIAGMCEQTRHLEQQIQQLQQRQRELGQTADQAQLELQQQAATFEQQAQAVAARLEQARQLILTGAPT